MNKAAETERIFKNKWEAFCELKRQKYKCGKSKFYDDCNKGICKSEKDGNVTEKALKRYCRVLDKKEDPAAGLIYSKRKKELEKLDEEIELKRMERKEKQGKLISKTHAQQEQASLAALFITKFRQIITIFVHDTKLRNKLLEETKRTFNDVVQQDREYSIIWQVEDESGASASY